MSRHPQKCDSPDTMDVGSKWKKAVWNQTWPNRVHEDQRDNRDTGGSVCQSSDTQLGPFSLLPTASPRPLQSLNRDTTGAGSPPKSDWPVDMKNPPFLLPRIHIFQLEGYFNSSVSLLHHSQEAIWESQVQEINSTIFVRYLEIFWVKLQTEDLKREWTLLGRILGLSDFHHLDWSTSFWLPVGGGRIFCWYDTSSGWRTECIRCQLRCCLGTCKDGCQFSESLQRLLRFTNETQGSWKHLPFFKKNHP